jgi:hypothetical protein
VKVMVQLRFSSAIAVCLPDLFYKVFVVLCS